MSLPHVNSHPINVKSPPAFASNTAHLARSPIIISDQQNCPYQSKHHSHDQPNTPPAFQRNHQLPLNKRKVRRGKELVLILMRCVLRVKCK